MNTQIESVAATLQHKLVKGRKDLPMALMLGMVSALREVADDESQTGFVATVDSLGSIASRLEAMAQDITGDMQQGYLTVAQHVRQYLPAVAPAVA